MEKAKTFKKHGNDKSLLNGQSKNPENNVMAWKEWKMKKKEEHKKWKQERILKKLQAEKNKNGQQQDAAEKVKNESGQQQDDVDKVKNKHISTVSIAVPGSIIDNAQSPMLKTYLAGQIARAAAVFNVNEIIVYSETSYDHIDDEQRLNLKIKNGCAQLLKILRFLECPQYLRKYYFPIQKDLEYAGLLNPLVLPSHLKVEDECKYREGIVLDKPVKDGKGSFVYIGLRKTAIIDKVLEPNVRVTVELEEEQFSKRHFKGKAVSPTTPYKKDNIYWGYDVRSAKDLKAVLSESPYKGGYDLTIGTSDKGQNVDTVVIPKFKHLLVVFGGLKGIESCLEADETIEVNEPSELFNYYLNTCPSQGSQIIRTEEAILITLAALRPGITQAQTAT
ncbi:putative methyltransferase C9orf114 [Caerostris darwini]|uniref:Methyltransferase C9orf114 n=1 Tax=Caerostris darwini TaxID=1538125 RepID=A0AAV4NKG1_9ARAC|nr:putative methyltransferase C9orf114 [Caerostris darwini]